jgi:ribosomal 50S subunit-recycling heat shock protein
MSPDNVLRLDKFLKWSRLIKRRTVANEFCDVGGVQINGRPAKAAAKIKVGDTLILSFGNKILHVNVLVVPTKAPSIQEADTLYEIIEEKWLPKEPQKETSLETLQES